MKPFDIELAKQGHPLCTRDGRDARFLALINNTLYPVVVAILTNNNREYTREYTIDGCLIGVHSETHLDLFMKSEKYECWTWCKPYDRTAFLVGRYVTKEEAEQHPIGVEGYVLTKLEWEE